MTMMHLRFPRKKGFFSWDELGCMSRALGFPANMFSNYIPDEYTVDEEGVETKLFLNMLNVQKYFHKAIDSSFNIHTDEWNLSVINKAAALLDGRIISFEELHAVRVAFQVYENADTKGMRIDNKVLQRALKMCGRMISPLKMMHRIKHMRQHFEEENRIQLHEFLDLLLWCEPYEEADMQPAEMDMVKDDRNLFALDDFEAVLSHYDERLNTKLNQNYIVQEWKFSKEKHGSKRLPKDVPPVDPQVREKQVGYHRERSRPLLTEVTDSQSRVYRAQAGYVRERPITAPDLMLYEGVEPSAMAVSTLVSRPQTVYQTFSRLLRPSTSDEGKPEIWEEFPRPTMPEYQRPKTPVAVTNSELGSTQKNVEALRFEMETIEMKYRQMLNEDMDFLLPGYREKMANRPPAPPAPRPKKIREREPRPSEETLKRLAYPLHRGPPPSHAKICDARYRGWHKVGSQRGSHFVLTAPAYDTSQKGQLLLKMTQAAQDEIERGDFIFRYTKQDQVAHTPRPHTSPADLPSQHHVVPHIEIRDTHSQKSSRGSAHSQNTQPSGGGDRGKGEVSSSHSQASQHSAQSDADSSLVDWTDLQMYQQGTPPESDPLKDINGEASKPTASPTKGGKPKKITMAAGTKGGEPEAEVMTPTNKGQIIEMKKLGKVSVLEEIKESDHETPDLVKGLRSITKSKTPSKLSAHYTTTPSETTGKYKNVTIITPTPSPHFDFIPRTTSADWIREVLIPTKKGPKDKAKKRKSLQSYRRLSSRAADVGLPSLEHRLTMSSA